MMAKEVRAISSEQIKDANELSPALVIHIIAFRLHVRRVQAKCLEQRNQPGSAEMAIAVHNCASHLRVNAVTRAAPSNAAESTRRQSRQGACVFRRAHYRERTCEREILNREGRAESRSDLLVRQAACSRFAR